MNYTKTLAVGLVALAGIFAGGCSDIEAGKKAALTADNNRLMTENSSLKQANKDLEQQNQSLLQQNQNLSGQQSEHAAEVQKLENANADLKAEIATLKSRKPAITGGGDSEPAPGWEEGKYGDKITIGSDVLFSSGSANLTRAGQRRLRKIASTIKNNYPGRMVRVYGYTDSDPIRRSRKKWSDNLDLSANRAMAVTRYLRKRGIAKENIETIGMGKSNPVANNGSRAGKAKNRRVEIVVIKPR